MSRYSAFISYSHADGRAARRLHRALETFRMPKALIGTPSPFGPVPPRLPPLFRDRDELPASGDLGSELRAALAASRFQIVLCSPSAARSRWVNEEVLSFKRLHGEYRTLALILSGEPYAGDACECFPPALRFRLADDGSLSDTPAEPIAADLRKGKDGRRLALLKLVAGIAGVPLDALVRRDASRRHRRQVWITMAALAVAAATIGLAIYAEQQRRVAERQRQLADKSLDFLIGTFQIANPATENPRTITALTILDRASRRAATELGDDPEVSARLLRATGEIQANLGLPARAEHDLRLALARSPKRGEARARALLTLARVAQQRGDLKAVTSAIAAAEASYDARTPNADALDAEMAERRGRAAILAGHYRASVTLLADSARRYGELPGDHRADVGRIWMLQAQSLLRLGHFAAADRLYAAATEAFLRRFGRDHVQTADVIRNRALGDLESGRLNAARVRIGEALAIYTRVLEPNHPTMGMALILDGRVLTGLGQPREALNQLERARTVYVNLYGARSVDVADADFYAAEAELAAGRPVEALTRIDRVKAIYDRQYGAEDPDQAELLLLRTRALLAQHRVEAARKACDAALQINLRLSDTATIDHNRRTCAAIQDR